MISFLRAGLQGELLLGFWALVAPLLISPQVPARPQEGMCHLLVHKLVPSATELLALNRQLWAGWGSVIETK